MNKERRNSALENRRTKLVCTVGPACRSESRLVDLLKAGMDVARLHFSYGSHSEHKENIRNLRRAVRRTGRRVQILQDLSGTKVRLLDLGDEAVELTPGEEFTLTARKVRGDAHQASISVPELVDVVEPGDRVLLADGALELRALSRTDTAFRCRVVRGGAIKTQQAVHVPGKAPSVRVPSRKDYKDIRFGLEQEVDWIALSYATTRSEVDSLRRFLRKQGSDTPIIAKIERRAALSELDAMIAAADAVMVARGDLGLEIPVEEIALVQKDIIARVHAAGKPVITATEMLVSMMKAPHPTRADVSDITNAILDGSDAVMLSGETAVGDHPVEAAKVMSRVAALTDARTASPGVRTGLSSTGDHQNTLGALAEGACRVARGVGARGILCASHDPAFLRCLVQQRPGIPIVAAGSCSRALRRLALFQGVRTVEIPAVPELEVLLTRAREAASQARLLPDCGRLLVIGQTAEQTQGSPGMVVRVETAGTGSGRER